MPRNGSKSSLIAAFAVLIAALGYATYGYFELRRDNVLLEEQTSSLRQSVSSARAEVARLGGEKRDLAQALEAERGKSGDLSAELQTEQGKNKVFEAQIKDISITVGALQKLSETDPELLKKYSRVYFLSENYAPERLSAVALQYRYDKNKPQLIHTGVAPFLQAMLATAERDGAVFKVVSAYRSFAEQASVKEGNKILYGSGANQFSADQGYSEHQLGTTVDVTLEKFSGLSLAFENSAEYKWLVQNAYKFGFILSYPRENVYYHFEPWHWRFVGVKLATKLHNENKYFYELAQRELDEYLISIFD